MFEIDLSKHIRRYSTTPEVVEAAEVTPQTQDAIAKWCGGALGSEQSPDGALDFIRVPTISGVAAAYMNSYVVKNIENGRFSIYSAEQFKAKGFHEVGLRQDGPNLTREKTITVNRNRSGEAHGAYADKRYQEPHDVLDMS